MLTLMGNKDIFKPSTFPKRKRKHEQAQVAKPRNLRYKPSIEALNILKKPINLSEGDMSEAETSLESVPNPEEGDSRADDSFLSQNFQVKDKHSLTQGLPSAPLPSLNVLFRSQQNQLPVLPHINIGQNLTLPSRHVNVSRSQQTESVPEAATVVSQQSLPQHMPEQQLPPMHTLQSYPTSQQNLPLQQETRYYYSSSQLQAPAEPYQLIPPPQSQTTPYPPSLIPLQQIPTTYSHNPEYYPSYQPPQLPPHPQYIPMHHMQQHYYQQPMSSLSLAPAQHQFYYNVVPYTMPDPYAGYVGVPRKSKQSSTWSADEDKLLRELKEVQKLGWREISTFFHERTPNACQFRWRRIISNLDVGSKVPSTEASDKEKELNASSFAETNFASQEERQSRVEGLPSETRASTEEDDDETNLNKKSHNQTNKIDFLPN